ncbi:MAG: PEP-utilizing enzyme [Patescibacteria group bacterium]|jgi:phosphohistidine swiveling domain-containing protein
MLKIPSAQNWRKIVARGKYPTLLIYELNQGLLRTHRVGNFKSRIKTYCRISGGSYLSESESQALIKELRSILSRRPEQAFQWFRRYFLESKKLSNWVRRLQPRLEKEEFSEQQLKKLYLEFERQINIIWHWCYLPFLLGDAIEFEIRDLFNELKISPHDFSRLFKILGQSPKKTLHNQEHVALLKLAAKIKNDGLKKHERDILKHRNYWGWKNSWLYQQHPLTIQQLKKELLPLLRKNPAALLRVAERDRLKLISQRRQILSHWPSQRLKKMADILAEATHWHSVKIEEATRIYYLVRPLFEKLAKTLDLSYEQFIELTPPEVISGKINKREIARRFKDNGVLMLHGRWQVLTTAEIKRIRKILEPTIAKSLKVSGFAAYNGKVTGRVMLIQTGVDFSKVKFKKGSILVTQMTTTNMVSLVKQAAAVVTDEGGVLSHAAIISREFKKPCIIGTKFATKIFKTGDLVEVDADKGLATKLK